MSRYAWLECPWCGGAFVRLRDPDMVIVGGMTVESGDFIHRDGSPVFPGEPITCDERCGGSGVMSDLFTPANVRRGDALPEKRA